METWRRVEVAACEELPGLLGDGGPTEAELEAIRARTFTVEAVQRARARHRPRRRRVRRRARRLGRRGRALDPLRADLLGRARHRARAAAARRRRGSSSPARTSSSPRSPRARASTWTRCASGAPTACTPSRRPSASSSPASRSRPTATRSAWSARSPQAAVGAISGAVGTYAATSPEFEARVLARLGLAREDVSTQVVARDRHAELLAAIALAGAGLERLRDRGPPPAAHRGARGAGAVPRRPEGLLGDAPQAQPDQERADLRPRARAARQRPGRARERRAVARARHLPLLGRARDPARLDDPARLPAARARSRSSTA